MPSKRLSVLDVRPENAARKEWLDLAARHVAEADNCRKREQESDTGGCLMQWGLQMTERLHLARAQICQGEGFAEFKGLYLGDRRIRAKYFSNKFGICWMIHPQDRSLVKGRSFIPCGKHSRVQKQLGLEERGEMDAAWVRIGGSGRGMEVYRCADEWGSQAKPMEVV